MVISYLKFRSKLSNVIISFRFLLASDFLISTQLRLMRPKFANMRDIITTPSVRGAAMIQKCLTVYVVSLM